MITELAILYVKDGQQQHFESDFEKAGSISAP
jgi:heme-degrading monooxygenase HmoA